MTVTLSRDPASEAAAVERVRVAIIGAGFAGLGMAIRLRQAGYEDFVVFERASEVGGTWRDNSYPGAAVDVRSHLYSYSFAPNPDWTQVLAGQVELWDYIRRVSRENGVDDHVRLETEVLGGEWDDDAQRWRLRTSRGDVEAQFVVSAMGPLSNPSVPDIPGLEDFRGHVFHSGRWDHDHDLTGERVGVIGTGSSAAQFVPEIAERTAHLTVFQRTPHWTFPRLNRRITRAERAAYHRLPALQRLVRARQYWFHELVLGSAVQHPVVTETISRARLRWVVRDPELRGKLTPSYRMGCKRIVINDSFLPALTRPDVSLVTDPIVRVTPHGVLTADGTEHPLDTIVLGTGFQVMPVADPLRGRDGDTLTERWADRRAAHLGTTVAGFPNYFMLVGPNTATGHTSILLYAEPQIEYVVEVLRHADRHGIGSFEVRQQAQDAFNDGIRERLRTTIWTTGGCDSWYLNERDGTSVLWPGFTWSFRKALRRFDHENYLMHRDAPRRDHGAVRQPD
ncbi:MAG: NAD(P)/FAD-dependent oxidoreductase [Frankiales bacterium]|jgi:cation diffusion facilitator CzcD-associated flavoprotein CzcO|nr:NAD(P)/FAD-dependent oxidoreductase [Frankiales bacterium]